MVSRGDDTCSCGITSRKLILHCRAGDGQHYLFIFHPEQTAEALRAPGRMVVATNGEFSWQDANVVCDIIRKLGAYDAE